MPSESRVCTLRHYLVLPLTLGFSLTPQDEGSDLDLPTSPGPLRLILRTVQGSSTLELEKQRPRDEGTSGDPTARTRAGWPVPHPQLAPHLQQLQQGRGIPVPSGIEEQDAHLRAAGRGAGMGGWSERGTHLSSRNFPSCHLVQPQQRPPASGPSIPEAPPPSPGPVLTLTLFSFAPPPFPSQAPRSPTPEAHWLGLWLRCSAWRNQRTQACTLLAVCAPSRYQVRGPRRSTCVRPSHSVSRSPAGGQGGQLPP